MSTATMTTVNPPASPTQRIWNIVRLHLANPWTTLYWPWIIAGLIYFANWAIAWVVRTSLPAQAQEQASDGLSFNGGGGFIFVYMMVVAIQAISITFPFALGYGVTRRDFFAGSALTFVQLSLFYTVAMTALSLVEEATDGWGVGLRLLSGALFGDGGWPLRFVITISLFLFFFFFGSMIAAIWVRWKATGVSAFFVVFGLVVVGAVVLITLTSSWGAVGAFFVHWGFLGSFLWLLVPTAISAMVGFLILRRATPQAA